MKMKEGVIIGSSFLSALIIGGEVEQGIVDIFGIICMVWLTLIVFANIRKKKARRGNAELSAYTGKVVRHSIMVAQTDLHVNTGREC